MTRQLMMAARAVVLAGMIVVGVTAAGAAPAGPVAAVRIQPADGKPIGQSAPVTFGMVFKAGDVPKGTGLVARSAGQPLNVQLDVKRRYADGSPRFAVVSAIVPGLQAAGMQLEFLAEPGKGAERGPQTAPPDLAVSKLLETDFDAVVTFKFPDGAIASASARRMLQAAAGKADRWLAGALANEWLLTGPPVDGDGRADPDLNVQFQVRAYEGIEGVRVSVVVENCWDTWAGNIGYDVEISLGKSGQKAFARQAVDHHSLSRWRKVFWWGTDPPDVHVVHDLAQLSATGAIPNYDTTLKVPEKVLAQMATNWAKAASGILENGTVYKAMPDTGGRPDIGPYPTWTAQYLLSMDSRAKAVTLGNGDLAGSWPIHVRNSRTGRLVSIDDRPKFWLDARGQDKPAWKPPRKEPARPHGYFPDCSHQPSLAFVPYLVTGEFFYLEEVYFWGNYCLLAQWPHPRQDAKGLVLCGNTRGMAWALRNVVDAAQAAVESHPELEYFDAKVRNNVEYWREFVSGPDTSPLGFNTRDANNAIYQKGFAGPIAKKELTPQKGFIATAPWQQNFLAWSLHHAVEAGYPDARAGRDYFLKCQIGLLTNPADYDPLAGTPYFVAVGQDLDGGKKHCFATWKELWEKNYGREAGWADPSSLKFGLSYPDYGGSYSYIARGALVIAVEAGLDKADEALQWLQEHLPRHREVMASDPTWALAPRAK